MLLKLWLETCTFKFKSYHQTSDAANIHSLRSYYQAKVRLGRGENLDPTKWGWYESDDHKFLPLKSTLLPALEKLLKVIRCKCKLNWDTKKYTCRKNGIKCTADCGEWYVVNCSKSVGLVSSDLDDC